MKASVRLAAIIGFSYASTVGLASRFAPPSIRAVVLVAIAAFLAFALATLALTGLVKLWRERAGQMARCLRMSPANNEGACHGEV